MKLLVIINNLGKGGAENLIVQILPEFKKRGILVELLQLTSTGSVPEYYDFLIKAGVKIHSLGCENIYKVSLIRKLKSFIKVHLFDLIHVHLFPAQYWVAIAFKASKTPLIFTEHNTYNRRWGKFYFKPFDWFTYKKYNTLIAITEDVKTALINWMPVIKDNVVVIKNGININQISNLPAIKRDVLLNDLGITNPSAKLLLMTSRFSWPKTQNVVVEAIQQLDSNVHLLLAGEGVQKAKTEKLVTTCGLDSRVHFLGFRIDVTSLMKSVDINILSTDFEGMSTATLEALAAGLPFLGSNVTGINNLVPDDRYLFERNNSEELAKKISLLLEDQSMENELSITALQHVQKFDITIMIEEHISLYKRVLN